MPVLLSEWRGTAPEAVFAINLNRLGWFAGPRFPRRQSTLRLWLAFWLPAHARSATRSQSTARTFRLFRRRRLEESDDRRMDN